MADKAATAEILIFQWLERSQLGWSEHIRTNDGPSIDWGSRILTGIKIEKEADQHRYQIDLINAAWRVRRPGRDQKFRLRIDNKWRGAKWPFCVSWVREASKKNLREANRYCSSYLKPCPTSITFSRDSLKLWIVPITEKEWFPPSKIYEKSCNPFLISQDKYSWESTKSQEKQRNPISEKSV